MITTLSFYDFDGTLIDSPMPDSGRDEWKNKTGDDYPHVGWWGRPDSLNTDVFDIKPFESVLNQLKADTAKSDTYTILLTARIERLRDAIVNVLNVNNIQIDEVSLKNGSAEKDDRIRDYLTKYPDVKIINLYDDRDKEMKVFSELKDELGELYQINIYRVTNGNFSLVESENTIKKIISEEISIYKKTNTL